MTGVGLTVLALVSTAYLWWGSNGFTELNGWVGSSPILICTVGLGFAALCSNLIVTRLMPDHPDRKKVIRHRASLAQYERDVLDWDDRTRETGLGYWRSMRGVEFEKAMTAFLNRRGCRVSMTKGSGDGGIDLIVEVGGRTYWGQCKAHAAPISVAPIREIAGVCSRGSAKPVVFAVNGFTRAAITTAAELGVGLVDAPNLVAMAKTQSLTGIG